MSDNQLFDSIKESILRLDPIYFAEKYLTLDGRPFRLSNNGYSPFRSIYRYIALKTLESNGKPVVLVKGRQVGATTMAAVLELYFMCCGMFGNNSRPPIRLIHCFPQLELAGVYAKTKLNNMIASAVVEDSTKINLNKKPKNFIQSKLDNVPTNDSLSFKQFAGGNHISIESTGLEADRLRGRSVDVFFADEVQDIRMAALGAAIKCLNKAQYGPPGEGVQVYFGTPKQKGSGYWKIWQASNQQYYHLGCEKCDQTFPLYTPGSNDWEKVWLHTFIVKCCHCGHEQDKRQAAERGKWVPTANMEDAKYVGYHINQLYMPEFSKEYIISQKPENHPINTERAYMNEVLGEFFAGSSMPLTPEEIDEKCSDKNRGMTSRINSEKNCRVYLGLDWGKKSDLDHLSIGEKDKKQQGQSYSVAVILRTDGPNLLSVEFATRLKRNSFEEKKGIVEQCFRQYNVDLAVGDIGYANDLSEVLQQEYGNRFLCSESVSKLNGHIKYRDDGFPNKIMFEKDYYIAELISMLKMGKIKFPYKHFDQIEWLVDHCCSMEIKPVVDRSGGIGIRYVKGPTPNDGLMALLNAYLGWKMQITKNFTITDPNKMKSDPTKKEPILACLGFVPTRKI